MYPIKNWHLMNSTMMLFKTERMGNGHTRKMKLWQKKNVKSKIIAASERMYEKKRYNIPLDKLKAKRAFEHMSHVHRFRWILLSLTGHRYTFGFLQLCRIVNGFVRLFVRLFVYFYLFGCSTKLITIRNSVRKILNEDWGKKCFTKDTHACTAQSNETNLSRSLWKIIALHYPEIKMEHAVGEPFCDIKC